MHHLADCVEAARICWVCELTTCDAGVQPVTHKAHGKAAGQAKREKRQPQVNPGVLLQFVSDFIRVLRLCRPCTAQCGTQSSA